MDITVSTGLINTLYYYEVVNIRETPLGYIYWREEGLLFYTVLS